MKKNNFGMWCQQAKKFLLGNAEAKRERELHKQAYREVQVKEYDAPVAEQARECWIKYQKEYAK